MPNISRSSRAGSTFQKESVADRKRYWQKKAEKGGKGVTGGWRREGKRRVSLCLLPPLSLFLFLKAGNATVAPQKLSRRELETQKEGKKGRRMEMKWRGAQRILHGVDMRLDLRGSYRTFLGRNWHEFNRGFLCIIRTSTGHYSSIQIAGQRSL